MSLLDADTVSVQPVAEATTDPEVAVDVLEPILRAGPLDGLQIVNVGGFSVNTSAENTILPLVATVNVTPPDAVAVNVMVSAAE